MGKVFSGISDTLFGSDAEQSGTAQSPGDAWLMSFLQPMLQQAMSQGMGGNPLYNVPQGPQGPGIGTPYSPTQMPFSSPNDYLQQGEMESARNVMENFYGSGGGQSQRAGGSGAGFDMEAALSAQLGQGAMGRYMQARLPYDQMSNQAGRDVFGAQNQMNLAGYGGQMQQYGYENQAMAAPWNMMSMYPGSTGSPMVQPGQQGLLSSVLPMLGLGWGMGGFSGLGAGAGAAGGIAGGTSSLPLGAMAGMSDIRLKKNINKIGRYKGMDVIEFEYLWGGGRKTGLIAQQVKEVIPNAVGSIDGYLYVNYALV